MARLLTGQPYRSSEEELMYRYQTEKFSCRGKEALLRWSDNLERAAFEELPIARFFSVTTDHSLHLTHQLAANEVLILKCRTQKVASLSLLVNSVCDSCFPDGITMKNHAMVFQ